MRVAVDCRLLGVPKAGSAYYMLGLLRGLAVQDRPYEYFLLCQRPLDDLGITASNFHQLVLPEAHLCDPRWEQLQLPGELESLQPDLYLAPTSVLPMLRCCPQVVVVYDLGFVHHPEFYNQGLRSYLRLWVPRSARNADVVICLSEYVKSDLCRTWGITEERVRVVPGAPDRKFQPVTDDEALQQLCGKYGLRHPFALSVASLERNKNLRRLLEAFALARPAAGTEWQLVLVGRAGGAAPELQATIAQLGLRDEVVLTGFVPEEELPLLYVAANLFAFVSLFEGFGLPPLEAMACGTPVLASNATSLPEVLGEAALFVDRMSVEDIANGLARLMSDEAMRKRLSEMGRQRAAGFSWEASAAELARLFEEIVSRQTGQR